MVWEVTRDIRNKHLFLSSLARLHVLPPHDFIRTVLSDTRNIDDLPEVLFAAWKFREMELRGAIKNVQGIS